MDIHKKLGVLTDKKLKIECSRYIVVPRFTNPHQDSTVTRKIFVLRHGQTQFNSERRLQGQCDSALTEQGAMQARNVGMKLGEHLEERDYKVYSSPLGRAVQTAQIVCEQIGHAQEQLIQDERLQEFSLGQWEQKLITELQEEFPHFMRSRDWILNAPESEGYEAVKSRLHHWLSEVSDSHDLIVVSHGLTGIVLRGILLNMTYEDVWNQDLPQDAFFIIQNDVLTRVEC